MSHEEATSRRHFEIGGRKVGDAHPPLVIAEIGINHEGSLPTAFAMVDAAARGGAEVIKHQTHIVEDEMSQDARKVIPGNSFESIYDLMERCALDEADEATLKAYVESKGMLFLSTPFSRAAADRLERLQVSAYKIGSGECNNYPLIEHIAHFGKPVIVSTGMNSLPGIHRTVDILAAYGVPYALLHTTNVYPTPSHLVRLGALEEMMEEFPEVVIGLSDHTTSNLASFAAVALGALIVERHFTDSMDRPGPDIVNSMDESALCELITGCSEIWKMRGGRKAPAQEEEVTMAFAFATVVATRPIREGEEFTRDNIWVRRPGTGEIKAEEYENVVGKLSTRNIDPGMHIRRGDVR